MWGFLVPRGITMSKDIKSRKKLEILLEQLQKDQ